MPGDRMGIEMELLQTLAPIATIALAVIAVFQL